MNKSVLVSIACIGVLSASCAKADDNNTAAPATKPLSGFSLGALGSCRPKYQVTLEACKENKDVQTGFTIETQKNQHPDSGKGICNADPKSVCQNVSQAEVAKGLPAGVVPESISLDDWGKDLSGGCVQDGYKIYSSFNVWCTWKYNKPVYQKYADDSCKVATPPVEISDCFGKDKDKVDIADADIQGCLDAKADNPGNLAVKRACLTDIHTAQRKYRLKTELSPETFDRIEHQMKVLRLPLEPQE